MIRAEERVRIGGQEKRAPRRLQRALGRTSCAAAAKAAALAAEKRKLTRLHFASVRSAVRPSVIGFRRRRRRREHELVPPLLFSQFGILILWKEIISSLCGKIPPPMDLLIILLLG